MASATLEDLDLERHNTIMQLEPYDKGAIFLGALKLLESKGPESETVACLLRELVENDQAVVSGDDIQIHCDELLGLDVNDLNTLGFPEACPYVIQVDSIGTLNEKNFRYRVSFHRGDSREHVTLRRIGIVLVSADLSCFLLSKNEFQLLQEIDEFHLIPHERRTFGTNLVHFGRIKEHAAKANARLDSYLANESAVLKEGLSIDLRVQSDNSVMVVPVIEDSCNEGFLEQFTRFPSVRETYTVAQPDGGRKRVVFGEQQAVALRAAKSMSSLQGDALEDFLEHPEFYFDPDIVDLDNFSRRVAEIGLYKPKYCAFISNYKSQWLPILNIETSPDTNYQIAITSREQLEQVEEAYLEALRNDSSFVVLEGYRVPVCELAVLLDKSKHHFDAKDSLGSSNDKGPSTQREVLLIRENIDVVDHCEGEASENPFAFKVEMPPHLRREFSLLKHQKDGLAWLQGAFASAAPGVLLADDMGLGKTLQVLSFFDWHQVSRNPHQLPYLVVAPLSLLENWQREYERFFEEAGFRLVQLHGKISKKFIHDISESRTVAVEMQREPILCLTTYETLRKEQKSLCRIDWACVALDEAQRIKTPGTLVTNAAKALKATFKIAMTGTPVENSFVELWCIMDFCVPGLLGCAKDFAKRYQRPMRSADVDVVQLGELLRSEIGVHILRRFKEDVLEGLPQKIEQSVCRVMPKSQLERYLGVLKNTLEQRSDKGRKGSYMLEALAEMKTISNHPFLKAPDVLAYDVDILLGNAARLLSLHAILKEIQKKGEKSIVFSESRRMQQILAKTIRELFGLSQISIINGDTPSGHQNSLCGSPSRQQAIDRFQAKDGFNVIIMSPLAAGVGLNVVGANHVIHFSRHWNPAKEAQATDRAYRIGQTKDVYVYYLLAVAEEFETFDVVLEGLLQRKKKLATASLYPTDMTEVGIEDMFERICGTVVSASDVGESSIL